MPDTPTSVCEPCQHGDCDNCEWDEEVAPVRCAHKCVDGLGIETVFTPTPERETPDLTAVPEWPERTKHLTECSLNTTHHLTCTCYAFTVDNLRAWVIGLRNELLKMQTTPCSITCDVIGEVGDWLTDPATVERVARAEYEASPYPSDDGPVPWSELFNGAKGIRRKVARAGLAALAALDLHGRERALRERIHEAKAEIERLRAWHVVHLSPECQHTGACDGCDGTVVCDGRCWCRHHAEDSGS